MKVLEGLDTLIQLTALVARMCRAAANVRIR